MYGLAVLLFWFNFGFLTDFLPTFNFKKSELIEARLKSWTKIQVGESLDINFLDEQNYKGFVRKNNITPKVENLRVFLKEKKYFVHSRR